jgi:putative transposase
VLSGIIFVIKGGLRGRDAPPGYGPHKTLNNRFVRWSRMGVFSRSFAALAGEAGEPGRLIIDSTHRKAHRTAASLLKRGRLIAASGERPWCRTSSRQRRVLSGVDRRSVSTRVNFALVLPPPPRRCDPVSRQHRRVKAADGAAKDPAALTCKNGTETG